MAAITPRIRWGSREVDWTWVPESTDELAGTLRPLFVEALGMLAFTFVAGAVIINGADQLGLLGIAVATAVAYGIIVSALYPISGGHINPAVTLAHVGARRMPPFIALLYIGAQLLGALLGGLLLQFIYRDLPEVANAARTASLSFSDNIDVWTGGFLEAILTFILVVVYFRAFVDSRGDRFLGGLGVGLVVLFGMLVAYPLTGGAMNLARVFGTDAAANHWTHFGSYWIGLIGGFVAGVVYNYLFASGEEEAA